MDMSIFTTQSRVLTTKKKALRGLLKIFWEKEKLQCSVKKESGAAEKSIDPSQPFEFQADWSTESFCSWSIFCLPKDLKIQSVVEHNEFHLSLIMGLYSPTILKNILCLFLQDLVNLNVTQLVIG